LCSEERYKKETKYKSAFYWLKTILYVYKRFCDVICKKYSRSTMYIIDCGRGQDRILSDNLVYEINTRCERKSQMKEKKPKTDNTYTQTDREVC
jgi:predicted nucleotidyltransferase